MAATCAQVIVQSYDPNQKRRDGLSKRNMPFQPISLVILPLLQLNSARMIQFKQSISHTRALVTFNDLSLGSSTGPTGSFVRRRFNY